MCVYIYIYIHTYIHRERYRYVTLHGSRSPRESFVRRETSSSASSSTTWNQAMRSLTQVVDGTSTLPPVLEEEDPDLGCQSVASHHVVSEWF